MTVKVDWENMVLTDAEDRQHQIFRHEFWYLAPSRSTWSPEDGFVHPLEFAFILHNSKVGQGHCIAMDTLLHGIEPKTMKVAGARDAEQAFEAVRREHFPKRPSRLNCHFLSLDKETAEIRADRWNWKDRTLVRCFLLLSSARYHYANVNLYERYALGENEEKLIHSYWAEFNERDTPREAIEILADSDLYFPDWETFPEMDIESLTKWNLAYKTRIRD